MNYESLSLVFSTSIQEILKKLGNRTFQEIEEIRIRVNQPLIIYKNSREYFLTSSGQLSHTSGSAYRVHIHDITQTIERMSNYSLYAFEEEVKQGFITLQGGHRVGLVGKAVLEESKIKTIRYIAGMNIRIAHQILGCADGVFPYIMAKQRLFHTLIASPPGCGKTTLLRDIIRQLSNGKNGKGFNVGVVDERSEIAGCYKGIPQNDLGIRTDVLDGCPKVQGIMMLIRAMSPQVIAVDEIGCEEDIYAIEKALNAGVTIISTVHAFTYEDLLQKPVLSKLLEKKVFERFILLSRKRGVGTIEQIMDIRKKEKII